MSVKLTTQEVITQCKAVHGDKYDYSKVVYVGATTKLKFLCKEHGSFLQTFNNFKKSKGCPACSKPSKQSAVDNFIQKAKVTHGDKYDYSKVVYVDSKTPVTITCNVGHTFEQAPASHVRGRGCQECSGRKPLDRDMFIKRSTALHKGKYDYSEVGEVTSSKDKVKIICPDHGKFTQVVSTHMNGAQCPDCTSAGKRYTTESFIEKCEELNKGKYTYEKTEYKGTQNSVIVTCKIHRDFKILANRLLSGETCPKCSGKHISQEEFIKRAKESHTIDYGYSEAVYVAHNMNVTVKCSKHGPFNMRAGRVMAGDNCPKCNSESHSIVEWEDFISKSDSKKFSYRNVVFKDMKTKVSITCETHKHHGDFLQTPSKHMSGQGCPKCSGKGLSIDELMLDNMHKHEGKGYVVHKETFTSLSEDITITCSTHGKFTKKASGFFTKGNGCNECAMLSKLTPASNYKNTIEEIHGNSHLDLSKLKYKIKNKDSANKIQRVSCSVHGELDNLTLNKLYRGVGCKFCSGSEYSDTDLQTMIKEKGRHDIADYSKSKFVMVGDRKKFNWTCKTCSYENLQSHGEHFGYRQVGCHKCNKNGVLNIQDAINEILKNKHLHKVKDFDATYDLSKVVYKGKLNKVADVRCKVHNVKLPTTLSAFIAGVDCEQCMIERQSDDFINTFLYLCKWTNPTNIKDFFYKIGIASNIDNRLYTQNRKNNVPHKCEIVSTWEFERRSECRQIETQIKLSLERYENVSKDIFPDGYTETRVINKKPKKVFKMVYKVIKGSNLEPINVDCRIGSKT